MSFRSRDFVTVLDKSPTHEIFQEITNSLKNKNIDDPLYEYAVRCGAGFDIDLNRHYRQNFFNGFTLDIFESNNVRLNLSKGMDTIKLKNMNIVIGPSKYLTGSLINILGHSKGNPDIKVPKNNIDKDSYIMMDLATLKDDRISFELLSEDVCNFSSNKYNGFTPNKSTSYTFQEQTVGSYYMPPNKAVRKEYREKIDALIKKVTLQSYLKDDDSSSFKMPKKFEELRQDAWKKYRSLPNWIHENAFDFIENNYEGQMAMKMILNRTHNHLTYTCGGDVIKGMIKHYTNFRNEVPLDYFTCDFDKRWQPGD